MSAVIPTRDSSGNIINTSAPFKSKFMRMNGVEYKLHETIFGSPKTTIAAGATQAIRIQCPHALAFFTTVSLISSVDFASVDFHFEVSDGQGGFISVYQHGHGVKIPKGFIDKNSFYEAMIDSSIYITAYITNPSQLSSEDFSMNVTLHKAEVVT